ncbi:hypothetical protein BJ912DRAFT_1004236 [Pholiota molesta]|nr:hypothetical protein BJ912DRAFT_1004236 [Pholiota molesta]
MIIQSILGRSQKALLQSILIISKGVVFLEPKMERTSALRHRQFASSHSVEDHLESRSPPTALSSSMGSASLLLSERDDPFSYNPITPGSRKNFLSSRDLKSIVPDGVTIQTIVPGDGTTFPKKRDTVTIHYVGTFMDGTKFESSRDRGIPFLTEIGTGKVIKGWDEAILHLSLGQKALVTVTPSFPTIPPNSTLKFEVELLKIDSDPVSTSIKSSSG